MRLATPKCPRAAGNEAGPESGCRRSCRFRTFGWSPGRTSTHHGLAAASRPDQVQRAGGTAAPTGDSRGLATKRSAASLLDDALRQPRAALQPNDSESIEHADRRAAEISVFRLSGQPRPVGHGAANERASEGLKKSGKKAVHPFECGQAKKSVAPERLEATGGIRTIVV
jgi:hypothetical protein